MTSEDEDASGGNSGLGVRMSPKLLRLCDWFWWPKTERPKTRTRPCAERMDEDPWTAKKEQGKDSRYQCSASVLTPKIHPPFTVVLARSIPST